MNREHFRELTEKYVRLDKEYKEYLNQFFTAYFPGSEKPKSPQKVLTREELDKLQAMHAELDKVHQKWLTAVRSTLD